MACLRTNKRVAPVAQTGENAAHRPLAAFLQVQRGEEVGENVFFLVGDGGVDGLSKFTRLTRFFSFQHFANPLKIKRNIFFFLFFLFFFLCAFRSHTIHALHVRNRAQKRLERVQHFLSVRSLRLRFDNPVNILLPQIPFLCPQSLAQLPLIHFHPLQRLLHPLSTRPFHLALPSQKPGNREFPRSLKLSQRSIASQRGLQLFFFALLPRILASIRAFPQIRSNSQSSTHFERSASQSLIKNYRISVEAFKYRATALVFRASSASSAAMSSRKRSLGSWMDATATWVVGATRSNATLACCRSRGVDSRKMRAKRERMEGLVRRAAQEVGRRANVVCVWEWD